MYALMDIDTIRQYTDTDRQRNRATGAVRYGAYCLSRDACATTDVRWPLVRLIAMILPSVMFYFGAVHLSLDILRMLGFKAPFRISSTPQGSVMPTALYVLVEDIVAVDGGGGQIYRYALRTRYLSSPYFRRMLVEMNYFWAGGSIIWAAAITAIIFTTPRPVGFTVSSRPPRMSPHQIDGRLAKWAFTAGMDPSIRLGRHLDLDHHPLGTERFASREEALA